MGRPLRIPWAAEVAANRDLLRQFWRPLQPRQEPDDVHWVNKIVYAREFTDAPWPPFQREAWRAAQPWLGRSRWRWGPAPAARLAAFYAGLDELAAAHADPRAALARDLAAHPAREVWGEPVSATYEAFLRMAGRRWTRVWHLVDALLKGLWA